MNLAEQLRLKIDAFHAAIPDQGGTGDGGEAGKALCQWVYDNAEGICAALSQPSFADGVEAAARVADAEVLENSPATQAGSFVATGAMHAAARIAAAIRSLAGPGEEWQPIETAPKDGRHVLLGDAVEQFVAEGFWEADYGDGYWCRANEHWTDAHDTDLGQMTHWRPLPAPPANAPTHKERG